MRNKHVGIGYEVGPDGCFCFEDIRVSLRGGKRQFKQNYKLTTEDLVPLCTTLQNYEQTHGGTSWFLRDNPRH